MVDKFMASLSKAKANFREERNRMLTHMHQNLGVPPQISAQYLP
jgi:hypothetical protein